MLRADAAFAQARCRLCPAPDRIWRQILEPPGISGPVHHRTGDGHLVLCKPERLCYTLPAREHLFRLFLGSSAVEHSTVNRMVAGSNPARGASKFNWFSAFDVAPEGRLLHRGHLQTVDAADFFPPPMRLFNQGADLLSRYLPARQTTARAAKILRGQIQLHRMHRARPADRSRLP